MRLSFYKITEKWHIDDRDQTDLFGLNFRAKEIFKATTVKLSKFNFFILFYQGKPLVS